MLTWFILPFFQEYYASGAFTAKERMKASLHTNGVFYAVMFGIGTVFVIYLLLTKRMGLSNLMDFIKALSNA